MMEILQKIHQIMDANVKSVDEYNLLCEMHNRLRLVTTHRQHADAMSTRATSIGDWGYVSGTVRHCEGLRNQHGKVLGGKQVMQKQDWEHLSEDDWKQDREDQIQSGGE